MLSKILIKSSALALVALSFVACKKDTFTPIDPRSLNPDTTASNTALDQWLKTTFLDEYNINVIYHYHRYYHEADRNVTPPDPQFVQPMMTTVLEGYILPYRKIAGEAFIKKTVPKEFVLYGSTSYDSQNIGYAGTATGGIRVNLFGVDNFSLTPSFVTSRLRVIHHEFTHILNQIFTMPPDFEKITASSYNAAWTNTPVDTAHKYGYVSSYASQNPVEDYAETTSSLLVSGQSWFDDWVRTSTSTAGQLALRLKESNVVNYFNTLGIDFRALQKEVQLYIQNTLKDPAVTFPYWLNKNLYKTLTVNLSDGMYTTYGSSPDFKAVYDATTAAIAAVGNANRKLNFIRLNFVSATQMNLYINYSNTAGSVFEAAYAFNMAVTNSTGEIKFTVGTPGGTTNEWANATVIQTGAQPMINYLSSNTFIGEWLQSNMPANMFTKTAGLYVKGTPTNYFYGPLTQ
ncbi:MAG: hypothetical protein J0I41_23310 [Filimonas sp.]|nr:hypothetical protein [Filimonas sp.]